MYDLQKISVCLCLLKTFYVFYLHSISSEYVESMEQLFHLYLFIHFSEGCNDIFCFRFSQQELKDGKSHVTKLTDKWFQDIQVTKEIKNK